MYIITLKITKDTYKMGVSFIKNDKEMPIRYILNNESELENFYKACLVNKVLMEKIENETIFEVSYISEEEFLNIIKSSKTLSDYGFCIKYPSNLSINPKMQIEVTNTPDFKLSTKIKIDGGTLTIEDAEKLREVMFFNGSYKILNTDMISKLSKDSLSVLEFLTIVNDKKIKKTPIEIVNRQIKNSFKWRLKADGEHFTGKLKGHQEQAIQLLVSALNSNKNILLADDMGLGKTITIIYLLNMFNNAKQSPNLVIVPKSVSVNWVNEFKKFAPNVPVQLVKSGVDLHNNTFITTYGHVEHNQHLYKSINWNIIVVDEAQQIKNHLTKQSEIICSLIANKKIAMTGTPIENSINDLWSIFKFLEPRLLGNFEDFKKIQTTQRNIKFIQSLIKPHFIRRVKTDESLNLKLPSKTEKVVYCELTEEQKKLYNAVIEEFEIEIRNSRSSILKYINVLKTVCNNHNLLIETETTTAKITKLLELIKSINHSKVIVFTQYLNTAKYLDSVLKNEYKKQGAVINGKLSAKQRAEVADHFQSGIYPYIILTLKSGNSGITLTESCNVIHYDRWWNPSVENQASDRAYRIGQKNDVNVFKLVCKNTLEERIEQILNKKTELFNLVINPLKMSVNEVLDFVKIK